MAEGGDSWKIRRPKLSLEQTYREFPRGKYYRGPPSPQLVLLFPFCKLALLLHHKQKYFVGWWAEVCYPKIGLAPIGKSLSFICRGQKKKFPRNHRPANPCKYFQQLYQNGSSNNIKDGGDGYEEKVGTGERCPSERE